MPITKISIIIPLYNQHKKLLDCLESIKNQTFYDFEVIIINDGSTDVSHNALCANVRRIAPNAKCLYQENQGAPSARNNGFAKSSGEYILFCDADVVMKPTMLEKMNNVLDKNPDISYGYSSFKYGFKKFKLWEFRPDKLREMPYIHSTSLIRRKCLESISDKVGPWDPNLKRLQDWDLFLTMLEKGCKGKWINEVLFIIKTGGSMSKWLPSVFARYSRSYQDAIKRVKIKHHLS